MVGIFGTIRFRVSDRKVLTFQNFKREVSATWNTIDRIGLKPLMEFGGANLQTGTLDITLDASLGVRPAEQLERIARMVESGESEELIIGKSFIGKNKWVITKSSESWNRILRGGELYRATVTLTLQEYL